MERLQYLYDRHNPKSRVLRRLWRCVLPVRADLTQVLRDQSELGRDCQALQVKGVIYAIYCIQARKLYIGQTRNSAMSRFQEHVRETLRGEGEGLHRAMRKYGWENFGVFPLEKVPVLPSTTGRRAGKPASTAFGTVATPRERFWIDRLHTYQPLGFNIQFAKRNRKRRNRRNNPMKWRKEENKSRSNDRESDPSPGREAQPPRSEDGKDKLSSLRWYGSRDWLRRCEYLARRSQEGTLDSVKWERYANRTLYRLLKFLECDWQSTSLSSDVCAGLKTELTGRILIRPYIRTKKGGDKKLWFRVRWTTRQLASIGLKGILCDPKIKALLPPTIDRIWDDDNVVIAKQLILPIRHAVCNYRTVVAQAHKMMWKGESCPCRAKVDRKYRPDGGCVLTGDLSIVRHSRLKSLLECGPNFRDAIPHGDALAAVEEGLDDFISRHANPTRTLADFLDWKGAVMERCKRLVRDSKNPDVGSPMLDLDVKLELRKLQRNFVFTLVDKAANNFAVVCKYLYCHVLQKELTAEAKTYELVQKDSSEVITGHEQILKPKGLHNKGGLPFMYWMPKFHKAPVGSRFIAASGQCSTATLSKSLSRCLTHVLRTLREKDNKNISLTGVRRYFVVESYDEVSGFLNRWRRSGPNLNTVGLYTGDFSTMYTTIPHEALFTAIEHSTREAFEYAAEELQVGDSICLKVSGSGCTWVRGTRVTHEGDSHTFTWRELNSLVRLLVSNTFLTCGDSLYRQTIGIPMGTNCAPVLANLFLYYHEAFYVSRIEEEKGRDVARQFHMTFRLIDDVLSVDNPHMAEAVRSSEITQGVMYPPALTLNTTSKTTTAVEFLGMNIKTDGTCFKLSVFDKRKTFPFEVKRYPLMSSLIPASIPPGVFAGQLHRGYKICSHVNDFLEFSLEVACALIANGSSARKLTHVFKAFVAKHVKKYHGSRGTMIMRRFCQKLGNR